MKNLLKLALAFAVMVMAGTCFKSLMLYIQDRPSVTLSDPLLAIWPAYDLSLPIFIVTYMPILVGIPLAFYERRNVLRLIYSYSLLQLLRGLCIWLAPLSPPEAMVLLTDPFSDSLVFGQRITKDLFFSGHVSTLVLFSLVFLKPRLRYLYRGLAALDALLLLTQHVHYTIDIVVAPLFALLAFKAVGHRLLPQTLIRFESGRHSAAEPDKARPLVEPDYKRA